MPKTKNKKLPHFKEILKIISKNQKSLPRSSNYWKTDLNIVNGLHEILLKNTDESLQNWWKKRGEYSSTEVSRFKADKQTRFIDMNIINWYSQNLNLNEQVERLKKNINDFKPAPDFVDEVTSKSIFDYLNNNIDTVSSFIIERLESYLLLKDYAGFFGVVLFYLAADMPDIQEKTYSYKNIIGTERTFLNDLFDDLDKGKFYDYYNYNVSYYPNIDGKYIKSVNKVSYLSHIKNIVKFDKPHIEYNYGFRSRDERDSHKIVRLEINGVSYVDSIEVETFETNGLLKFKKKYRIKGVPDNNTYEVIRETEHLTGYPINDLTVRLYHPSKKFTFSASIDDTDDEYGILFNLKASVFLPFRQKKRTSMCKITRTHVDVQVDEFLPNGSGINIIVQPFLNKNFDILLGMSKYNKEDVHKMEVYNYWMNPVDKDETNNY